MQLPLKGGNKLPFTTLHQLQIYILHLNKDIANNFESYNSFNRDYIICAAANVLLILMCNVGLDYSQILNQVIPPANLR